MAYNNQNQNQVRTCRIKKNDRGDYVDVQRIETQSGNLYIDIRQMYTTKEDEIKPTQKGVRLNSELVLDLLVGILKAADDADLINQLIDAMEDESDDEDGEDEDGED